MIISKIFHKLDSLKITFPQLLVGIGALLIIRALLEGLGYENFLFTTYVGLFLVLPLFYLNLILAIILVTSWITKQKISSLTGIFLFAFTFMFITPFIHLFSAQKQIYPTIIVTSDNLLNKLFTYLFASSEFDLTLAAKIQTILGIVFITAYIFYKTKSFWKSLLGFILSYIVSFIFLAFGSIFAIVVIAIQKHEWSVSLDDIFHFFNDSPGFLVIRYANTEAFFSSMIGIVYLVILIALLFIAFGSTSLKKLKAFLTSLRPSRLIIQFFIFGTGCFFGYIRLYDKDIFSFDFYVMLVAAIIGLIGAWIFGVLTNDIVDKNIDKISNQDRPIPQGILSITDSKNLAIITCLITLGAGLALGYKFFFLYLVILAIAYVYSVPPLRLKKWPFISQLTLAGSGTLLFVIGYLLFNANYTIINLPREIILLVFLGITLLSSVKDLKDYSGDKVDKIYTIPTLFGLRRSKIIISVFFFIGIMLFPLILKSSDLLWASFAIAIAEMILILDKEIREKWIFGLVFIYIVLVYLIAF